MTVETEAEGLQPASWALHETKDEKMKIQKPVVEAEEEKQHEAWDQH